MEVEVEEDQVAAEVEQMMMISKRGWTAYDDNTPSRLYLDKRTWPGAKARRAGTGL